MKIVLDTTEFQEWSMRQYDMTNNEWHKIIWRPFMCGYFMESNNSVCFEKFINPENLFEKHMNSFIEDNPQLNGKVWLEFTN